MREPAVPSVKAASMKPPTWLDTEGKACWRRTTKALEVMGILSPHYRDALAALCQNWALFVKTARMVNELQDGSAIMDARPLTAMCAEAHRNYAAMCDRFGLSPSAKGRIAVPEQRDRAKDGKSRFFNPTE